MRALQAPMSRLIFDYLTEVIVPLAPHLGVPICVENHPYLDKKIMISSYPVSRLYIATIRLI